MADTPNLPPPLDSREEPILRSFGEYVFFASEVFTICRMFSSVCVTWSKSLAEYKSTCVKWYSRRLIVDVRAYAAGASLFLPMVMKNRDMSWKHPSKTRSTMKMIRYMAIKHSGELTLVIFLRLINSDVIQWSNLLDDPLVQGKHIWRLDILRSVLLKNSQFISNT